jgi:hypothetical protein|tara:strand:- start:541 stop:795 length:255 start_codon:yes stop_codon:yes gene_type:complete
MQDRLEEIKELAQMCLDNLSEQHYYRSPRESATIDNLKNIVTLVNDQMEKEKEQAALDIEVKRVIHGPHYNMSREEYESKNKNE